MIPIIESANIRMVDGGNTVTIEDDHTLVFVSGGARGPAGPEGPSGVAGGRANGVVNVPNVTWLMTHNLGINEANFNPALWWFENELGEPMEPVAVVWINNNQAVAEWLEPQAGTWNT